MDYSIIIPAWNEESLLPATLASVDAAREAVGGVSEVIVVDNNSTDDTAAVAERLGVRVVFEPINQISRARNAGGRAALGQYLVFIDADTVIEPELLQAALTALRDGGVCSCGAAVEFDTQELTPAVARTVAGWNKLSTRFGVAAGSFIACSKEGFDAIEGFSDRVYAGEEIFFSHQIKRWGKKRGERMRIITEHPVLTSARKLQWHSVPKVLASHFIFLLFPPLLLSKRFCRFWYVRAD